MSSMPPSSSIVAEIIVFKSQSDEMITSANKSIDSVAPKFKLIHSPEDFDSPFAVDRKP